MLSIRIDVDLCNFQVFVPIVHEFFHVLVVIESTALHLVSFSRGLHHFVRYVLCFSLSFVAYAETLDGLI